MRVLKPGVDIAAFWKRLGRAASRGLLLDYDGTLAPFRVEREHAAPYPQVRDALRAIVEAGHTRVVIISGRPALDVQALLGISPAPEIWGDHGWERLLADGRLIRAPLSADAEATLRAARDTVERAGLAQRCEFKHAGIALHVRGLPAEGAATIQQAVLAEWHALARTGSADVRQFDGGIELRAVGADKGHAVRTLLPELAVPAGIAYAGDDLTDEDAFRALADRGLSLLVRDAWRETAADVWLRPPDELLAFLGEWNRVAERDQ